jgi:quercetin dioxygenase-like cupin family protein
MNIHRSSTAARLALAITTFGAGHALAAPAPDLANDPARHAAQVIEKTLQKHAPEIHRCFEKALADRLDVSGNVEVEVDVGKAGKVTAARLAIPGGGEAPSDLTACVQEAASHFVLEGIEAGASVDLPFAFAGQADQFAVKVADVPERGPRAAAAKRAGKGASANAAAAAAPFAVKLLIDPVNVRTPKAALTLLTVLPKSRVAPHRHPKAAKAFYLLSGRAHFLGPAGTAPITVEPGTAIFVPPGYPHALDTLGRSDGAVFLQIFTPPGPEQVYRDPADPEARAAFEVLRDGARLPAGAATAAPVVVQLASTKATPIWGGKATAHTLLDQKNASSADLALLVVDVAPGAQWPRHGHEGASELIYVASGGGTLEVGSETTPFGPETALYLPAGQPHALKFAAKGPTQLIQIFAPAGPEGQASAGVQAGKQEESGKVMR